MKFKKIQIGDWVLHKTEYGKVWKLCEVKDRNSSGNLILTNLKAKDIGSWGRCAFYTQGNPVVIPVAKGTSTKNMSMKSLITLYGRPQDKNLDQWTFFKESTRCNIQINSKNKDLIEKLLKLVEEQDDIKLVKLGTNNSNIDKKYEIKDVK